MNIFECGIKISLVGIGSVTSGLAAVAQSLTKTQSAATMLQSRMDKISSIYQTGIVKLMAGTALAAPLIAASRAAEDYTHKLNQMASAGMTNQEIAESVGKAWETSSKVITSSVTDNLDAIKDLKSVFGSTSEAIKYMPKFAKIQGAYAGILDGKLASRANEQTFAAAKTVDSLGLVNNSTQFNKAIDSMFRVTEATLGRVLPSDYLQTLKYSRTAKFGLGDDFLYKKLPELILENKTNGGGGASGVGTQIMALYRAGVQGVMTKVSAHDFASMGMVAPGSILKTTTTGTTLKGGLLGSGILEKDPVKWVTEVLVPHLVQYKHIDAKNTDALITAAGQLFKGNRLAGSLVAEIIKKPYQYDRFGKLYDKTMNPEQAYDHALKNDPKANWKALGAAWENVKLAIGENILPTVIPLVNKVASSLQGMGKYLHEHPGIAKTITGVTALTSGALILGGALNIANAAAMGLGLGLGPLGITLAAVGIAIANWDKITGFFKDHSNQVIHVIAETCRFTDRLSAAFKHLCNWIGNVINVASIYLSVIPGMKDFADNLNLAGRQAVNSVLRGMQVDDVTAQRDKKYLQSKGMGGVVDMLKGSGPAGAAMPLTVDSIQDAIKGSGPANSGPSKTTFNYNPHIEVHAPAGANPKEIASLIDKKLADSQNKFVRDLLGAGYGGSPNSVGRPSFAGGATR